MVLDEQTEKRIYDKMRAFDGLEVAGHEPVDSSIASVLSEGEVLADDGNQYSSIQDAIDASDGWTFVGPGTYYENVVIDKDDFTLQGAGYNTLIDGGSVDSAIKVRHPNITVSSLSVKTSRPGNAIDALLANGNADNTVVDSVTVRDSDSRGVRIESGSSTITSVVVENSGSHSIDSTTPESIISNCIVESSDGHGLLAQADDCIIANSVVRNTTGIGVLSNGGNDCILIGNRVINAGNDGMFTNATDCIIANNRISGSTNSDIDNQGTGTVTDANLTGSAN